MYTTGLQIENSSEIYFKFLWNKIVKAGVVRQTFYNKDYTFTCWIIINCGLVAIRSWYKFHDANESVSCIRMSLWLFFDHNS